MGIQLTILVIFLILSAFFSAAEVAFVSLTSAKIDVMAKKKLPRAHLVKKLKQNPRRLLIAILIGNNIVNIAAASLATVVMAHFFDSAVIGITTGVMTLLVLIFGEILPKSYASNHAKQLAIATSPILYGLTIIGYPVIVVFEFLTRIFTGKQRLEHISEEEIQALTDQGARQGAIEPQESLFISRLFKLNDTRAQDIMTKLDDIAFITDDMSIDQATEIIEHYAHTRFPVYHETPDTIIGMVHSRDVLLVHHRDREHTSIKNIVRPVVFIKNTMYIDDAMAQFQTLKTHMGIVTNKHKKTLGIITLEDIIEELVGEIEDEYDEE